MRLAARGAQVTVKCIAENQSTNIGTFLYFTVYDLFFGDVCACVCVRRKEANWISLNIRT
jgi:hypothetical protein